MKKSQSVLSVVAIVFATVGALASSTPVSNTATAKISAPPGCVIGTTNEDGCTLTISEGLVRCTMNTNEGTKDAYFSSPACTVALWRQP